MAPLFTRTRSSSTVTHGAALDFETLYPDGDLAPVRLRPHQDTLLRVINGDVRLTVDRDVRLPRHRRGGDRAGRHAPPDREPRGRGARDRRLQDAASAEPAAARPARPSPA